MTVKTYKEAVKMVQDYASSMNSLIRTYTINNGTFALIGHFIGQVYDMSDEQIIKDFVIEVNGITYPLIKED